MSRLKRGHFYVRLSDAEAARVTADAQTSLHRLDVPGAILDESLTAVHAAIDSRRENGIPVDPVNPAEVGGLVCAALGGNDHIRDLRIQLSRYVVGFTQSDSDTFQQTRQTNLTEGQ